MSEKMLYILGVATEGDKIKSENKNTQLETLVETYVGVHSTEIVSGNITVDDKTQYTWFNALNDVYDGNKIVQNLLLIDFLEDFNTKPKEDLFLLRMMYSEGTKNISEDKIEIIFFNEDGSKKVPDIVNDEPVIPESKSKTIKVLIKNLTGIEIEDSVKDSDINLTNMKDANNLLSNSATVGIQNTNPRFTVKSNRNPNTLLTPVRSNNASGGSSHKTRKGKQKIAKNNKKGGSKTKRKSSKKRVNKTKK